MNESTQLISFAGLATGILGSILGLISFFRTGRYKRQDLRIQLRIAARELWGIISDGEEIILKSEKSRQQTAAAKHELRSGKMEKWKIQHEIDCSLFSDIKKKAPKQGDRFNKLSEDEIEDCFVQVESLKTSLKTILNRYTDSLSEDKKDSERLMEQAIKRHEKNP